MGKIWGWCLVIGLCASTARASIFLDPLFGKELQHAFEEENHELKGHWEGGEEWGGRFCDGYYHYGIELEGTLANVDFELNERKQTISIYGKLDQIYGAATGAYRSAATLCFPVGAKVGIGAESAEVFSEITMGPGETLSNLKVRILATRFKNLTFRKGEPSRWYERFMTQLANQALSRIWASFLGDWIGKKIGDIIKEKLPEGPPLGKLRR